MNDTVGDCKSCASSYYCDLIMNGTTDTCPCKTCLVKMTCLVTCDIFSKAWEEIIGFPPSSYKGW